MDRAYSLLEIRSVDREQRTIEGIASTPTPDRMGDIVEPMGAKFRIPMPLLWQHKHDQPVGNVTFAQPTPQGIPFRAQIARIEEPGTLKDRVDEAWQSVKAQLVRAVSIGFKSLESERMAGGGMRFKSWEWLELSLVSIPAQAEATITTIKRFDQRFEHASESRANSKLFPLNTRGGIDVDAIWDDGSDRARRASMEAVESHPASRIPHLALTFAKFGLFMGTSALRHLADLERRISEIEEKGTVSYRGAYNAGETYVRGDMVSYGGSVFHCTRETIGCPPMHGLIIDGKRVERPEYYPWELAVKRGRDRK